MYDKILALLTAKHAGVRKDGLAQLARLLAIQATTEDEATALIEKVTTDQVNSFVKDYRKDVDKEISSANKTFETTLKEKFDITEKKAPEQASPAAGSPTDIAALIAAEIAKAVNPLQQKLASYETDGLKKLRLQTLEGKLVNVPETFKAQKLKDFGRMNFETEETFNEYLNEFDGDITAFNQELADRGLAGHGRPMMGGKNAEGVSSSVASFIASKADTNKPLAGKEV